jgi:hypothetical protein
MTMVVGMNLGFYVLIVADTRMTYYPRDAPRYWKDGRGKVYGTNLGIIAGAGFGPTLDAVRERLAGEDGMEVRHLDDVRRVASEEFDKRVAPPEWPQEALRSHQMTGWLLTYLNPMREPGDYLRMAFVPGSSSAPAFVYEKGDVAILGSVDLEAVASDMQERLSSRLKVQDGADGLNDSLAEHVVLAASAISKGAELSEGISQSFQVGIYTQWAQHGISEIATVEDGCVKGLSLTLHTPQAMREALEKVGIRFVNGAPPA